VGLAAFLLGIPLAIHEQNAILGFTNRWLARLAVQVYLSFPDAAGQVAPARAVLTGNPIRPEFFAPAKAPRPKRPFTVLVMGGSQGAHHINLQVLAALEALQEKRPELHFIHLSGSADLAAVREGYQEKNFSAEVYAFHPDVADFMRRSHLVVCRAGASTLAELTALGRAAILVPYPFAANQHQEKNAQVLREAGGAYLVHNRDLDGATIAIRVMEFLHDPQRLAVMEDCSRSLGRPAAAADIARACGALVGERRPAVFREETSR
jgi:UDP-N-acetylglucosamine--N-acetylmuramyl-(pentapeptide) pyrophosphoryl-undecaprenol N-acetylglucosamine transferase